MKSYKAYLTVLFINAFIDLGHKITMQNIILRSFDAHWQIILSSILGAFLVLPFVTFFSLSGYLSDKYSKSLIMRYSAISAFVISIISIILYVNGDFWSLYFLTILYALQAAIFSPAKFGYIKDMTSSENILKVNATVQALTMTAMISAGLIFSLFFEILTKDTTQTIAEITKFLWPIGIAIVFLTAIETIFSYRLAVPSASDYKENINYSKLLKLGYLKENLEYLTPNIRRIVFSISIFWALAQVISAVFPSFAFEHLGIINLVVIQEKLAMIIVGMVFGSIFCAKMYRGFIDLGLASFGAIGMSICILGFTFVDSSILLSLCFLAFGFFGSCFVIPLNSYIQYKTEENKIGRVIAGLNFIQSLAMLIALLITSQMALFGFNGVEIFWVCAALAFMAAFFVSKEPFKDFIRFLISLIFAIRYKIVCVDKISDDGSVMLLGNHTSWIDWAILQIVYPKRIHFVMDENLFQKKGWRGILKFFNVAPIASKVNKSTIIHIRELLLSGKVVCIFPEGEITRTGELGEFKRGFEVILKNPKLQAIKVIPFCIDGLLGSSFSHIQYQKTKTFRRKVVVSFGAPLSCDADVNCVKLAVEHLKSNEFCKNSDS